MADKVKCAIVSGAPGCNAEFLKNIEPGRFIIAADSGYKYLLKTGLKPDLIIADFDSSERPENLCEIFEFPSEKAYTDTFNCVIYAVENGFKDIEIYNALGSRFDHSYANVLCLDYCRKNDVKCVIKDENNRLTLIENEHILKKEYENFSLFAFLGKAEGVKIEGAYYTQKWYNKDEFDFDFGDQFAVSNFVNSNECKITVKKGTLLLCESNG